MAVAVDGRVPWGISSVTLCYSRCCDRQTPMRRPVKRRCCAPLVTTHSDDRSSVARAYQWASRIILVSLEMVLPGLVGYWLDTWLGSVVVFMLIGFAAGCTWGVWHLVKMTSDIRRNEQDKFDDS